MSKRVLPPSVNVYFSQRDREFMEKFVMAAQRFKISESRLAVRALRKGLNKVVQELETEETKVKLIDAE